MAEPLSRALKTNQARAMARSIQAEDIAALKRIQDVQISPDGKWVIYVLEEVDRANDQRFSNLWLVPWEGGPPRQLTYGTFSNTSPVWRPDSSGVAFLTSRTGTLQIFFLPIDAGEASQLSFLPQGAGRCAWSPDGERLVFSSATPSEEMPDGINAEEWAERPRVVKAPGYKMDGAGLVIDSPMQLYVLTLKDGTCTRITQDGCNYLNPIWSPDGMLIAYARSRQGDLENHRYDVWVTSPDGTDARKVSARAAIAKHPVWSPNGRSIAFYGSEDPGDALDLLWVSDLPGDERPLTQDLDREVATLPEAPAPAPVWSSEGDRIYVPIADRGNSLLAAIDVCTGTATRLVEGPFQAILPSASPGTGRLAFVRMDANSPGEIYAARTDGSDVRKLTAVNEPFLDGIALTPILRREIVLKDGARRDAWLALPPESEWPAPLLLEVHGGPHSFEGDRFPRHLYWHSLPARSWAVASMNFVGSSSYGIDFAHALRGRWGEACLSEQLEFVDQLVQEGIVDPDRIALTGYSYGGFFAAWAIGHTNRFKAAVVGAPITNVESDYGTADSSWYVMPFDMNGHPEERGETYRSNSAVNFARRVTTPTLFLHGEADQRCPIGQSEEMFLRLKVAGVPTEFVRYPSSGHEFPTRGRPSHAIDYERRVIDWITKWVSKERSHAALK